MRVAIMQPYFFPYIGYFQLIGAVDLFIVYDNIQYTKKGWINRNRMLLDGKDVKFTVPVKRDSDFLDVRDREVAGDFNREKLLNRMRGAYSRAPHFSDVFPLIEEVVRYEDSNLFCFVHHSIVKTCERLEIGTEILVSSDVLVDHNLKNQDRVIALCREVGASTYVNAFGGQELYSKEAFQKIGIELRFIKSKPFEYPQFGEAFVPWLSIIDVMMFNSLDTVRNCIAANYELI